MAVARLLTLIVAILACAWFVLGIRQSHQTGQASAIVSGAKHITAAQAARADSLLHEAKLLNPDTTVNILRAEVASARGDNAAADRILIAVTRQEPDNLQAWAELGRTAVDRRVLLDAYGHLAELDPPVK